MKKGPFEVLDSKVIYQNPWIKVREDSVKRPDGTNGIFGVVDYAPGVHIMALDRDQKVCVIKEYMYAIERYDIMFPAGGIDEGETPLEAAKRELLEEIGYESKEWIDLGVVNPLTMIVSSPFYLFLALNCIKTSSGESTIEVKKYTLYEVEEFIKKDEITLSGTIAAYFKAKMYFEAK